MSQLQRSIVRKCHNPRKGSLMSDCKHGVELSQFEAGVENVKFKRSVAKRIFITVSR